MTDEQFDKLCDFLEELVGENWNAFYNAKDDKLTICFHHEEKPLYKWRPLSLKTLNGDDIVAYESSCCKAIADKKYQCCPNCGVKMDGGEK